MKRILFITLAVLLSTLSASAVVFNVNGIAYSFLDDGKSVCVTQGGDYTGSVIIPERVTFQGTTYSVTSIRAGAFKSGVFQDCSGLTSVTIPNSVTTIGTAAFEGCTGLTSVIIGNSITIPNPVTTIGMQAFGYCPALTSVTIGNSVSSIGENAFGYCPALTSVTIGNSVTSIDKYAFDGCTGLTSVTIPNSVTSIGYGAFKGCTGLTSVTIGNSVTSIEGEAFYGSTALKKIYSLNPEPPQITNLPYNGPFNCYKVANLFVPKGCVSKYKKAEFWRHFKFIREIEEEGGIDDVIGADSKINYDGVVITMASPSAIAVYSIDGRLVATANGVSLDTESLTHGTYVVRAVDAHGNVQTLKFIK